jgi:HAD superfamily hydrolase (TIGR01549 family)
MNGESAGHPGRTEDSLTAGFSASSATLAESSAWSTEMLDPTDEPPVQVRDTPKGFLRPMEGTADTHPPALEALTVDLWYTLIYPTPSVRGAIERARRTVWAEALRNSGCSPKRAGTWAARIDRAAESAELEGWSPSWNERVDRWSLRIGVRLDAGELADRFTEIVPLQKVHVAFGADKALAVLRRRGFRLAIVSNVTHEPPQAIHAVLATHGLDKRFDTVVLSTDVGRAKPRREPFRRALDSLGVAPGRTVHIGDSAVDFQGARGAGIRPLLFTGLNRWKPETLQKAQRPWMRGALKVSRWEDVPRAVAFYETLPTVPREVSTG